MRKVFLRGVALALALVVLTCLLSVSVSADEDHLSTFNFSVTSISSSAVSGTYDSVHLRSVLYNAYFTNSAVLTSCNRSYVYGYFWDEYGRLCQGAWVNPKGINNASVLGVYPLSSLELAEYFHYYGNNSNRYIYFSKHLAESTPDFLTSSMYAVDWLDADTGSVWFCYFKSSSDTTWATGAFNVSLTVDGTSSSTTIMSMSKYYAAGADAVLWNVIPAGGTAHGSSSGVDPNTQPYISVTAPGSIQKGLFVGVRAELANRGDITGDVVCFISGHNSARTFLTEYESSTEGVYVWNVNCGPDENSDRLTLTFMIDGRPDITSVYTIYVSSAQVDNEGSSGDIPSSGSTEPDSDTSLEDVAAGILSLPDKILDGIRGLFVPDAETMAFHQERWSQLLADRFGAVYEAVQIVDEVAGSFTLEDGRTQIEFPSVTIPFGDVEWTFGGWIVDVVPAGFEFLIEALKKIIDIVCTLAFVNAMKNRMERTLEERA